MKHVIPVRALIIDDDDAACRKLQGWLTEEGFDVGAFTDPSKGAQHAIAQPPDVAIIDLRMPQVDGVDLIASLRGSLPETRFLGLSAFPESHQVIRAMEAGARELLEKPVQKAALIEAVDRQLADIGIPVRTEQQFNRRLGSKMREIRLLGKRTQNEIANAAGITAAQLSQIELGKTATTTWTLARICGALRCPIAAIFENGAASHRAERLAAERQVALRPVVVPS